VSDDASWYGSPYDVFRVTGLDLSPHGPAESLNNVNFRLNHNFLISFSNLSPFFQQLYLICVVPLRASISRSRMTHFSFLRNSGF